MQTKQCSKCREVLTLSDEFFQRNMKNGDGTRQYWRPECKKCNKRETQDRRRSRKMYNQPTSVPLGTPCDNCARTDQKLVFDHCHDTLVFRGWLCNSCNKGLGLVGDSIESVERLLRYMKKAKRRRQPQPVYKPAYQVPARVRQAL